MKKLLFFLYSTLCIAWATPSHSTFAQTDSVRITHTQEAGTLEKQQFIDRYDYVFMTKEPTKWMLKGYGSLQNSTSSNIFDKDYLKNLLDFRLGIEHKITPSFSLELDITYNAITPFSGDSYGGITFNRLGKRWLTSIESKWYYAMANRIKQGKSSNNFSGNYLSLKLETAWVNDRYLGLELREMQNGEWQSEYFTNYYKSQIGLNYGAQRRFFKHGLIDFSIGLNLNTNQRIHKKLSFSDTQKPIIAAQTLSTVNEFSPSLTTNIKIGIALADFKKPTKIPVCDVFRCFENENTMWKIDWPRIKLSPYLQLITETIGFEQKILKSSFSINTYFSFSLHNSNLKNLSMYDSDKQQIVQTNWKNNTTSATLLIQPRWYFLIRHKIQRGESGNNLSGPYVGVNTAFYGYHRTLLNYKGRLDESIKPHFMNTGLLLGFQKRLFNSGFFDLNVTRMMLNRPTYIFGINDFILNLQFGFTL